MDCISKGCFYPRRELTNSLPAPVFLSLALFIDDSFPILSSSVVCHKTSLSVMSTREPPRYSSPRSDFTGLDRVRPCHTVTILRRNMIETAIFNVFSNDLSYTKLGFMLRITMESYNHWLGKIYLHKLTIDRFFLLVYYGCFKSLNCSDLIQSTSVDVIGKNSSEIEKERPDYETKEA